MTALERVRELDARVRSRKAEMRRLRAQLAQDAAALTSLREELAARGIALTYDNEGEEGAPSWPKPY
jgi:hypothetical protein